MSDGRSGDTSTGRRDFAVDIPAAGMRLPGDLSLPPHPAGLVLFAHGSGSSRASPRNRFVAGVLLDAGLGTLLFDLLTPAEDRDYATRFDIPLLTSRLLAAARWTATQRATVGLPLGYFGASTGAAAALAAAATGDPSVGAVVSRGGRPDLAGEALARVHAPTLLIVGGDDTGVLALNREALARLGGEKSLHIVPGATHLFEEPGTLDDVAAAAAAWFVRFLGRSAGAPDRAP